MNPYAGETKEQLGENFRAAILSKGYTPTELATTTGTHPNLWHERCNGKIHIKLVDVLVVTEATDIDPEWLIRRILGIPEPNYIGILNKLHSVLSAYDPRR